MNVYVSMVMQITFCLANLALIEIVSDVQPSINVRNV